MYKYTERFVADRLFYDNCIRIGTLHGFRDMEKKHGISDPLEGSYKDRFTPSNFTEKDYYKNPALRNNLEGFIHIDPEVSNFQASNCTFTSKRYSSNYLIFCTAHHKSRDMFRHFDGANICYHIHDQYAFYRLITETLCREFNYPVRFTGVHQVVYGPYERQRTDLSSSPIHPALAKIRQFEPQCELRAIWEVPVQYLTRPHYDLVVPGLRYYSQAIEL